MSVLLEEVKEKKWKNVTGSVISLKCDLERAARLRQTRTRSIKKSSIFWSILSPQLLEYLAECVNASIGLTERKAGSGRSKKRVSADHVKEFVAFIVVVCANQQPNLTDFLRNISRRGIGQRMYATIESNLKFRSDSLFTHFNEGLKATVLVWLISLN